MIHNIEVLALLNNNESTLTILVWLLVLIISNNNGLKLDDHGFKQFVDRMNLAMLWAKDKFAHI